MKTREQNRNNKRTEREQYDWFVERIQTLVAFDWLSERSGEKTSHARELSRNQSILRFDVMLQHHWPIEGCLLHIRVFFGGKTKSPCFDLFIHWLIKQIMNTYRNHFSRSNENRSISKGVPFPSKVVCIRVRGWTSWRSLPVRNFVESPSPGCLELKSTRCHNLTSMCLLVLYACCASWLFSVLVTCRTISFSVCLPVYGVVPPILPFLSGWQR